jgi:hypothetical protein
MLNANLIREVNSLPLKDRVALMEYLAHSVQKELGGETQRANEAQEEPPLLTNEEKQNLRKRIREELAQYRSQETATTKEGHKRLEAIPSFESLHAWHGRKLEYGALKELSHLTDEDVENIIAEHIQEKYLK